MVVVGKQCSASVAYDGKLPSVYWAAGRSPRSMSSGWVLSQSSRALVIGVHAHFQPPYRFVAAAMNFSMMPTA